MDDNRIAIKIVCPMCEGEKSGELCPCCDGELVCAMCEGDGFMVLKDEPAKIDEMLQSGSIKPLPAQTN